MPQTQIASLSGPLAAGEPALAGVLGGVHSGPIAPVILGVTGILSCAVLGRFAARRFGQPSVLRGRVMGLLLGNLGAWLGLELIEKLRAGPAIFDMVGLVLCGEPLAWAAQSALGPSVAPRVLEILQGPGGGAMLQVAQTVDVFSRYGVIFLLFLVGAGDRPR